MYPHVVIFIYCLWSYGQSKSLCILFRDIAISTSAYLSLSYMYFLSISHFLTHKSYEMLSSWKASPLMTPFIFLRIPNKRFVAIGTLFFPFTNMDNTIPTDMSCHSIVYTSIPRTTSMLVPANTSITHASYNTCSKAPPHTNVGTHIGSECVLAKVFHLFSSNNECFWCVFECICGDCILRFAYNSVERYFLIKFDGIK